eukprot:CAMPEP_0173452246 /NCGR_PEP_ID=MMETSP1357-20121228/48350_1 /TAXON_ID=77926 /ORGANISM="Hemiselmis rufescens, Strain PCC563" /LENGTH=50 /DNA_ID=CAMNT_0014419097 /DNA_START=87 /DNA_END=239 /DNA_ORIENTATION=-
MQLLPGGVGDSDGHNKECGGTCAGEKKCHSQIETQHGHKFYLRAAPRQVC